MMPFSVVYAGNNSRCGHEGACHVGTSCVRPALFHEPHFCLHNTYRFGSFNKDPEELYCPDVDSSPFSSALWISCIWAALLIGFMIGQYLRCHVAGSRSHHNWASHESRGRHSSDY